MTRRISLIVVLLLLVLGVGLWAFGVLRRVDGRSAAQWLALTQQAAHTVTYHAEGHTTANGTRATFTLDQGEGGRYTMHVTDANGRCCALGFDGKQHWYDAGQRQTAVDGQGQQPVPTRATSRILGAGRVAGRPVVRLVVYSKPLRKEIAVDRKTGVILAMTTRQQRRVQSDMRVDRITYQPVQVAGCATATTARAVSDADARKALGTPLLRPAWLPAGFVSTGVVLGPCNCCDRPMATLHYTNGVTSLTLFEMADHGCVMASGCAMAPDAHTLVEERTSRGLTITAVTTLTHHDLTRVLDSLR